MQWRHGRPPGQQNLESYDSGALIFAPHPPPKSALPAKVGAFLPVSLLDVNSPPGRQLRSTGKQSRPLHCLLFYQVCCGLKSRNFPKFSILYPQPKPCKCKVKSNKVLMVFKLGMQDIVATSLQFISAGSKGYISVYAKNIHQQICIHTHICEISCNRKT